MRSSKGGFTLIEVLITVVILSTGIVLVLQALDASLFHLGVSRDTLLATMLINEKMVEIEASALAEKGLEPGSSNGRISNANGSFRWEQSVKRVPDLAGIPVGDGTEAFTLNEVVVTVWRENSSRKYLVTTYVGTSDKQ